MAPVDFFNSIIVAFVAEFTVTNKEGSEKSLVEVNLNHSQEFNRPCTQLYTSPKSIAQVATCLVLIKRVPIYFQSITEK